MRTCPPLLPAFGVLLAAILAAGVAAAGSPASKAPTPSTPEARQKANQTAKGALGALVAAKKKQPPRPSAEAKANAEPDAAARSKALAGLQAALGKKAALRDEAKAKHAQWLSKHKAEHEAALRAARELGKQKASKK